VSAEFTIFAISRRFAELLFYLIRQRHLTRLPLSQRFPGTRRSQDQKLKRTRRDRSVLPQRDHERADLRIRQRGMVFDALASRTQGGRRTNAVNYGSGSFLMGCQH
jgi:hypothetical protein